ncbi:MAG: hypothetical protein GX225_02055 [Clostridiales bacterium]|nr:hypothetical protein [Clostridiales bacterium]
MGRFIFGHKKTILAIILVAIGIYFIVIGRINDDKLNYITNVSRITLENISKNEYVEGELYTVLGGSNAVYYKNVNDLSRIYYIPIDNYNKNKNEQVQYIPIYVSEKNLKDFEVITKGNDSASYHLTGKIVDIKEYEEPYDKLKNILKLQSDEEVDKLVSNEYMIEIVDFQQEKKYYIKGIVLMILGLVLLFTFGERNS